MNEFTAKKLGKVLAFVNVSLEMWDRGRSLFDEIFGAEKVAGIIENLKSHKDIVYTFADRAGMLQTVLDKAEETREKLVKMQDLYMGEKWQNSSELLEWLGFFEGGAVVHSSLLQGTAKEMGHEELESFATQSFSFHKELLDQTIENMHLLGRKKASP